MQQVKKCRVATNEWWPLPGTPTTCPVVDLREGAANGPVAAAPYVSTGKNHRVGKVDHWLGLREPAGQCGQGTDGKLGGGGLYFCCGYCQFLHSTVTKSWLKY